MSRRSATWPALLLAVGTTLVLLRGTAHAGPIAYSDIRPPMIGDPDTPNGRSSRIDPSSVWTLVVMNLKVQVCVTLGIPYGPNHRTLQRSDD